MESRNPRKLGLKLPHIGLLVPISYVTQPQSLRILLLTVYMEQSNAGIAVMSHPPRLVGGGV